LKGKWKNLKDKFRIEVNKIPGSRSGAENVDCTSKWLFFDLMLFVKDTILPSPTTGNLPHSAPSLLMDDDSQDCMEDTLDNDDNTAGDRALPSIATPVTSINRRVLSFIPTSRTHPNLASGNSSSILLNGAKKVGYYHSRAEER
jgi:hypothetical protein